MKMKISYLFDLILELGDAVHMGEFLQHFPALETQWRGRTLYRLDADRVYNGRDGLVVVVSWKQE